MVKIPFKKKDAKVLINSDAAIFSEHFKMGVWCCGSGTNNGVRLAASSEPIFEVQTPNT
jgi:hypothetical protein